jgi:arylsulfatase A-like enzyme
VRVRLAAAFAGLLAGCAPSAPPSVVLVTLDTVRCDHLGIHGDARGLSPNLDRLARAGLVHERAFTTMPTTGPAHLSLFTGLHPSEHGARANAERPSDAAALRSLAGKLRERGFATGAFVSSGVLAQRAIGDLGFEVYDAPAGPLRPGSQAVDAALAWLAREPRRPLLLWLHLYDAHAPYGPAVEKPRGLPIDPARHGFVRRELFADPAERRRTAERYAEGVRDADAALGRLLDALPAHFGAPPLVVVAGDHGEALDEHLGARGYAFDHGEFLDEDVVCIPLVLAGPGVAPGRSRGAVSLRDLYPSLLRAAGLAGAPADGPDLRAPGVAGRVVAVERRRVQPGDPPLVRTHGAASFDDERGVVLAEDGQIVGPYRGAAPEALVSAARSHLATGDGAAPAVDPALVEALRSLGYAN